MRTARKSRRVRDTARRFLPFCTSTASHFILLVNSISNTTSSKHTVSLVATSSIWGCHVPPVDSHLCIDVICYLVSSRSYAADGSQQLIRAMMKGPMLKMAFGALRNQTREHAACIHVCLFSASLLLPGWGCFFG